MWVPGGRFTMGCGGPWAGECYRDEAPSHERTVAGFWLGRTEVTQTQWETVMGSNPSHFKGADRPVEQVSWEDARSFLKKLNGSTSHTIRLPTEAEWEYACRSGGKEQLYCGGNDPFGLAWYTKTSNEQTRPVGGKRANGLGLLDMTGNVMEWVEDCYRSSHRDAPADGGAVAEGPCERRVLRGGSWSDWPRRLRSLTRIPSSPDRSYSDTGFRVVMTRTP